MPDVRMPDGTIIRNVPEGTKRSVLERRYQTSNKPTSFWQGVAEGGSKVINNALDYTEAMPVVGVPLRIAGEVIDRVDGKGRIPERARDATKRNFEKSKSRGSTIGKITGEVIASLPLASSKVVGPAVRGSQWINAALQGGLSGALVTEDPNDKKGVARDAAIGAVSGTVGDVVGRKIVAPAVRAVARTKPVRTIADLGRKAAGKAATPVRNVTQKAVNSIAPNVKAVRDRIAQADEMGLPYALADADPNLRVLAGSVSRQSPTGREIAEQTFDPRHVDQADRAMRGVSEYLAPPVDIAARQDEWRKVASEQANPLYEEAFQGGSTAPLEVQLTNAFNKSSASVAEARAALAAAEREATLSAAQVSRSGNNVYQNAQALPRDRAANAAIESARQRLIQAESDHALVLDQLRKSQGDASNNAPGAVWNPRLQQFIDDPLSQGGLSRGLEIQRLEALADGRHFDPTEYAVIGMDDAGNPIVGNVPNLRTLDAIKKGYDAILDDYPRDMKGKQIFDQRGRAITKTKQALVDELDNLTGGAEGPYASARSTYGTYAQRGKVLGEGYDAAPRGTYARDIESRLLNMDEANLAEYQSGFATRLRDMISDSSDSSDPYKMIYGGTERRSKINAVFPEGAPKFDRQYQLEKDMAKTRYETLGGSPTAARTAADQMFQGGIPTQVAATGMDMITGSPGMSMLRLAARKIGDYSRTGGERRAAEMAPALFNTDTKATLAYLDELLRINAAMEAERQAYERTGSLLGIPSAAASVSLAN